MTATLPIVILLFHGFRGLNLGAEKVELEKTMDVFSENRQSKSKDMKESLYARKQTMPIDLALLHGLHVQQSANC